MITEDYVSFETAKLLKEKRFEVSCMGRYSVRSKEFHLDCTRLCSNSGLFECAAPSQAMAMKWLREVHNIIISIAPQRDKYYFTPWQLWDSEWVHTKAMLSLYNSYEEAVEAAIKYSLKNLIK